MSFPTKARFISFLFVTLVLGILKCGKAEEQSPLIVFLPSFSAIDIFGNNVNSSNLRGRFVYVQFIRETKSEDFELLKSVYYEFKNEGLQILVFTESFDTSGESLIPIEDLHVIIDEYLSFVKVFKAPLCCDSFYLFSRTGELTKMSEGKLNNIADLRAFLVEMIEGEVFSPIYFVESGKSIIDIELFDQVKRIIDQENSNYFIISMFKELCYPCNSGLLIKSLAKLHKLDIPSFYFLAILHGNHSERDVNNLKEQLGIDFNVMIANDALSTRWNELAMKFRSSDVTGLVWLIDHKGKIIKTAYPGCNCLQSFFSFLAKEMGRQDAIF